MIVGIPAEDYAKHRAQILPFLETIAGRCREGKTTDDLEMQIMQGVWQVWSINDFQAVCLTRLTPQAVWVYAVAGVARHEWQGPLDDHLRAWGKALGKQRIIGTIRPGWWPWAKSRGYRELHREVALEI